MIETSVKMWEWIVPVDVRIEAGMSETKIMRFDAGINGPSQTAIDVSAILEYWSCEIINIGAPIRGKKIS
jgi:hypothetical protein